MRTLCRDCADIVPTYILREMLCGHSADIVRTYVYLQGYMSALYPSRFSALELLRSLERFFEFIFDNNLAFFT